MSDNRTYVDDSDPNVVKYILKVDGSSGNVFYEERLADLLVGLFELYKEAVRGLAFYKFTGKAYNKRRAVGKLYVKLFGKAVGLHNE